MIKAIFKKQNLSGLLLITLVLSVSNSQAGLWDSFSTTLSRLSSRISTSVQERPIITTAAVAALAVTGYALYHYYHRPQITAAPTTATTTEPTENDLALIAAARSGDTTAVTALIAAGANVNAASQYGNTALIWAARNGHTAAVTDLIAAGAHVNTADQLGIAALMWAAFNDHTAIVTALITAGAEIPAAFRDHPTVLAMPANIRQLPPLVRALISPYHICALRALETPSLAAELAGCDLSTVDLNTHKFMIRPGTEIIPGGPVATGATRLTDEIGPETLPEYFSVLDLAIISCQPALVDQLLMAGMDQTQLAQQTQALLSHFNPTIDGIADAKGSAAEVDADSAAIAQMIYHATMARSTEVQNRISGNAGAFNATPLPAEVIRYAQAIKAIQDRITAAAAATK